MRRIFKILIAAIILPCLLFAGCAKNVIIEVYSAENNVLVNKHVKVETLSPEVVLQQLSLAGMISENITVNDFKSEGGDNGRYLTIDLGGDFTSWLSSQEASLQKLIMQSLANTFIHNYSATDILVLSDGAPIKTGLNDFSGKLYYVQVGTTLEQIVTTPPATAEVITPTPTPEITPEATKAPATTPGQTPQGPFATPERAEGKKYVAITFDDGPHSKYTTMLVDKLKEYNASATFFIVGNRVDSTTASAIKYVTDNGSELAIHGYTHTKYYNKCTDAEFEAELSKTADAIKNATGTVPTLMRPPGGSITNDRVKASGYSVILWNVDSEDWKHKKNDQSEVDAIVSNVMNNVSDGSIVLMHELYENSYKAFCVIIEQLYAQGYEVVTVSELLGTQNTVPGTKYYSAKK
jgi:peptidoglycan/xylan/chitin deacetylase (PgdA/CDA1 family)